MANQKIDLAADGLKHSIAQTSLDRVIDRFGSVVSSLFAMGVVISFYEIVMRYAFDSPTVWVHESTIGLVAFSYLFGGMYCLATDKHIRIGLIYFNTTGRTRQVLDIFNSLMTICFAVALSYAAWGMAHKGLYLPTGEFTLERSGSAWNPIIPAIIKLMLFVTASMLAVQSVLHLFRAFKSSGYDIGAKGALVPHKTIGTLLVVFILLAAGGFHLFSEGRNLGIEISSVYLVVAIMLLMLTGMPLAFVTALVAIIFTLAWFGPMGIPLISSRMYSSINEYVLAAIPMFVLMASILDKSGMADDLFDAARLAAGRIRGGLAIQTLVAAVFLAAISGVIGGEIVLLGLIALPQMLRLGYDRSLAIGVVCAGGSLGTMIPPSIVLIVYGLVASVSIGDLFLATVVPGIMLASIYATYILVRCYLNPALAPVVSDEEYNLSTKNKLKQLKGAVLPLGVAFIVLGSIYGGVASVTEAACLGVIGVLASTAIRGELNWALMSASLKRTMGTCGMIIWIILGASALVGVYNLMGGNLYVESAILALDLSPILIIMFMMLILLLLGLFMDWTGIALLTMPIFVPIVIKLGFDPIWFGILFAMNMQVSYLSPPFGPAAFYLKSVAPPEISLSDIFKAVWPFIILQLIALSIVLMFPDMVLWLPRMINGY